MSTFFRMALLLTACSMICGSVFAQDFVPQWQYEAGNSFGVLSMSPNAQYIAVQVYVWLNNNPSAPWSHEVHLLDASGNPIWKKKWDAPEDDYVWGLSVSNQGDVAVVSSAEPFNMALRGKDNPAVVYLIDKNGKVLFRNVYGRNITMFSGVSITPDGNNLIFAADKGSSLILLDRNGKRLWSDQADNAKCMAPSIAQGGNLIFYEGNAHEVCVWNGQDKKWWSAACYYQLCRISPNGQWVAAIVESDDPLADAFKGSCENYGKISIYNSHGRIEVSGGRTCTTHDFAVTDNGMVVDLYSDMQPNVYHVRKFDLNKPDETPLSIYKFETPSGKHGGGSRSLEISSDGQVVTISTPYTIYYLKAKILEKKW